MTFLDEPGMKTLSIGIGNEELNSLNAKVPIIQRPVNRFALQIN